MSYMNSTVAGLLNLLLPPRCPVSGDIVDAHGLISPNIWKNISFIEPPCCHACGMPFSFAMEAGALCGPCSAGLPVFGKARSAMVYDDSSRDLILAFKHGDKLETVPAFIPFLKRAGAELLAEADYLMPVPLHRWRLLMRRYNQAGLLAQRLGREAGKPVLVDALCRTRATPTQGHMNAGQREKNVRNAFAVRVPFSPRLQGKNILLVDDVYTTGATVGECAKALLKAGAAQVNVLTLARVVRAERLV